ncbi:BLUF domain-containing protein [Pedobacter sp. 22163]|uniref:BLUF domain-containing protein n=1 Tax=Pedobacter sp. 22163 TaxID=3453883 RepID=UPI003F840D57
MLFHLIYFSKARTLMPVDGLTSLLNQSSVNNLANDITGMLLYMEGRYFSEYEGRFMQVLEGSESNVKKLFEKIAKDERHQGVLVLRESFLKERNFPDWTMGFKSIRHEEYQKLPGFFPLGDDFLLKEDSQKGNAALDFLKSFYDISSKL